MSHQRHSRARLLAPIALVAFAIALLLVLAGSGAGGGGGDDDKASGGGADTTKQRTTAQRKPKARARRSVYTVKTGDTLGAISERTGVPVEALQELNPALDPQALVSGQKIKLRE